MVSITKRQWLAGAASAAGLAGLGGAQAQDTVAASATAGPFVTRHAGVFNGRKLSYTATVGETILRDGAGVATARFVSTSYVRDKADQTRPVIFAFNGGPSSSSQTLHMMALGPKRPPVAQNPRAPEPTPSLIDNSFSVLDAADIVMVDPAETGFSRVLPGGKREYFYSVEGDAQSVSDFVVAWCQANGRQASPKYVLGESYGTLRAAFMAGQLAKTLPLDGVFIFGQAVNMIETSQRAKNAVSYATNITALAAIAAYHGKADRSDRPMNQIIDEAYAFGIGEYLQALVRGNDLPAVERQALATKLQAMTGVSADYYLANGLTITKMAFQRELLKDEGLMVGMYDARYVGPLPKPGERLPDPSFKPMQAIGPMMLEHYAKNLGVTWPASDYRSSAPQTSGWTWAPTLGPGGPFYDFDYQSQLSKAFEANPKFRLMVGTGIFDLTTTVGPARYLVSQSDYPRERVIQRQYVGGHMAYTNEPTLKAFNDDVRAFVTGERF